MTSLIQQFECLLAINKASSPVAMHKFCILDFSSSSLCSPLLLGSSLQKIPDCEIFSNRKEVVVKFWVPVDFLFHILPSFYELAKSCKLIAEKLENQKIRIIVPFKSL